MHRCQTCGGQYERIQADGLEYYHACAPLNVRELREAVARQQSVFSRQQAARIEALKKLDEQEPLASGAPSRVDQYLETIVVERPDKRDETPIGRADPGQPAPIRSEGKGVTEITP
jgi:hypothetical protein